MLESGLSNGYDKHKSRPSQSGICVSILSTLSKGFSELNPYERGLNEQRRKHQRNRAEQLYHHVKRRACGVLERIANRIPNDRCLMRV